ncbi:GNAT family N-acetyltransferase [Ferroplasma sp.]|uniref:GNAT family N-acetyltransferase n=1 Tax=Ferroplasma sp. TaxID=2591003 RepID=UPI00307EB13E
MNGYTVNSGKILITTNFPIGHINEFIECANDSELGFDLMNHGFNYPYTEEDAREFIEKNREIEGEIFAMDFYIFYDNNFAGVIGLSDIDYENSRSHIGYWIGKKYRNKGIGSKALELTVNFARDMLKLHSLHTKVLTENIPSIIILERNGFSITGIEKDSFLYNEKFYSAFIMSIIL